MPRREDFRLPERRCSRRRPAERALRLHRCRNPRTIPTHFPQGHTNRRHWPQDSRRVAAGRVGPVGDLSKRTAQLGDGGVPPLPGWESSCEAACNHLPASLIPRNPPMTKPAGPTSNMGANIGPLLSGPVGAPSASQRTNQVGRNPAMPPSMNPASWARNRQTCEIPLFMRLRRSVPGCVKP